MKLRDLYKEFVRLHLSTKDKFVGADIPEKGLYGKDRENAEMLDWYCDGFSLWGVLKTENPFNPDYMGNQNGVGVGRFQIPAHWISEDDTEIVVERIASPKVDSKLIKLVGKDGDYMYLDSRKIKFFDNDAELRIVKKSKRDDGICTICQVVEFIQISGVILGVIPVEKDRF